VKLFKKRFVNFEFSKTVMILSLVILLFLVINFINLNHNIDSLNNNSNSSSDFSDSIGKFENFTEIINSSSTLLSILDNLADETKITYEQLKQVYNEVDLNQIVPFDNGIFRIEYREFDDKFYVFLNTSEQNAMEVFLKWLDLVDKKGEYKERIFIYDKINNSKFGGPPVE